MTESNMEHVLIKKEFESLKQYMTERFDKVETKQDETNGRVKKLEIWKAFLAGGMSLLTVLILPILFIIVARIINDL